MRPSAGTGTKRSSTPVWTSFCPGPCPSSAGRSARATRAWVEGRSLVCEVSDRGHITAPLVGRMRPALDGRGGAGLWVVNQLCDLVQIFSSPRGTTVRVYQGI